ncbi:hypothetical protein Psta_1443 [Pirellula staleyi DSM 6068]|uniref:Uncharacterized protein n=1 Tax=Pirellula staleyi (strain ATCC 27377 / DSM 6068 / ICPB 4128) TaxID=530564 RepID=D2QX14_PIRSD|nr:hypothetical protein Psta_1443 [Pirellula staleyi DSM 6068]
MKFTFPFGGAVVSSDFLEEYERLKFETEGCGWLVSCDDSAEVVEVASGDNVVGRGM